MKRICLSLCVIDCLLSFLSVISQRVLKMMSLRVCVILLRLRTIQVMELLSCAPPNISLCLAIHCSPIPSPLFMYVVSCETPESEDYGLKRHHSPAHCCWLRLKTYYTLSSTHTQSTQKRDLVSCARPY
jgi:hypothetical protein